jgi:hypothetical protein
LRPALREARYANRRAARELRTLVETKHEAATPRSAALVDDTGRAAWLHDVEKATAVWRLHRAAELRRLGDRTVLVQAASDELEDNWQSIGPSRWYECRALAHEQRWERLSDCQQRSRVTQCDAQPNVAHSETVLRCDHWRLCISCRGARAQRYRARFTRGRAAALENYDPEIKRRTGQRWSEKFVTLTVPHSGSVSADIAELAEAWPRWRARVARYLKACGVKLWRSVPFWRSLEVTASSGGHAHYHVWMIAPYLPAALARHWWGLSLSPEYQARCPRRALDLELRQADKRQHSELRRAAELDLAARPLVAQLKRRLRERGDNAAERAELRELVDAASWLFSPVVDVRRPSQHLAAELVKYIVKDLAEGTDTGRIPPAEFASIYSALDGVRAVATSSHLVDAPRPPAAAFCQCCGTELQVRFVTACSVKCFPAHFANGPPPPAPDDTAAASN